LTLRKRALRIPNTHPKARPDCGIESSMRDVFPAHFRPTSDELGNLWKTSTFAVDANVLLNLYRYSPETRSELEAALKSVEKQLFLPHQAAKEFLRNRLTVTAGQADEYTDAVRTIQSLASNLADRKRHPFVPEDALPEFQAQVEKLQKLLEGQRDTLLARLTHDEILDTLEKLFAGRTGKDFDTETLKTIVMEGERRYAQNIPPGDKDVKKDGPADDNRKYGDLILWKQLIDRAKEDKRALIFVTDDKKDDWWLQQSGRTIGPRIELREEFLAAGGKDFWMYTVDLFIEQAAKVRKTSVSQQVIDEIKTVREERQAERESRFRVITRAEMLKRIAESEEWAKTKADGFVGIHSLVLNYLGNIGYDFAASFDCIDALEKDGLVEVYEHLGPGHARPVRAVRLVRQPEAARPVEGSGVNS